MIPLCDTVLLTWRRLLPASWPQSSGTAAKHVLQPTESSSRSSSFQKKNTHPGQPAFKNKILIQVSQLSKIVMMSKAISCEFSYGLKCLI